MEDNIVHEVGDFYVYRVMKGYYEVRRNVGTHAVRVATFHFSHDDQYARKRAIDHANKLTDFA